MHTENTEEKNKITLGILAHVDAGKTTLAEAFMFLCKKIKSLGRVDHRDTFLDTFELERKRGITIFSKEAKFSLPHTDITLIDTPGHTDFAIEAERSLFALDYAVLVISAVDSVQSHTLTLWELLAKYNIPTFIFVNKTDISTKSKDEILKELSRLLSHRTVDFTEISDENIATCDESLMNIYLETGKLSHDDIKSAIKIRRIFPVLFGSALKLTGVSRLLEVLDDYTYSPSYNENDPFSAKVYKISRDSFNARLTHVKITSGKISVRSALGSEKITDIRFYSGTKYESREAAYAGDVCVLVGLTDTFAMQTIGENSHISETLLSPVMSYKLILPPQSDTHHIFMRLKNISEEIPELSISYIEETSEIEILIMGEIQIEILKYIIKTRLDLDVGFGAGTIIYKETVSGISEGVGHFEPLRHYAEVHLLIEPGGRGTGIQFESLLSEDILPRNYQHLIKTHVLEKKHRGVLTGSLLTDVKITLVNARAHEKHTVGGDFRQSTYRAIRHGLMLNHSVLLEPVYDFALIVPLSDIGRAATDIEKMCGKIRTQEITGNSGTIYGSCPVSTMHNYQLTVSAYTKGLGKLLVSSGGYDICHNADEVIKKFNYNPEADLRNTPDSVFCAHGAGFTVFWNEVTNYMHLEPYLKKNERKAYQNNSNTNITASPGSGFSASGKDLSKDNSGTPGNLSQSKFSYSAAVALDKDLSDIFKRTFKSNINEEKRKKDKSDLFYTPADNKFSKKTDLTGTQKDSSTQKLSSGSQKGSSGSYIEIKDASEITEFLLVDGYNIIFGVEPLNELSKTSLDAARGTLSDMLCNYAGYKHINLILVFDAYKVTGGTEKTENYKNISIVYTREAETADRYIERTTKSLTKKHHVTVATSDQTEQIIIWGAGARRMSARELYEDLINTSSEISRLIELKGNSSCSVIDSVSKEVAENLNKLRLEETE